MASQDDATSRWGVACVRLCGWRHGDSSLLPSQSTPLAELGTIQLEYRYLSKHVNNNRYADMAEAILVKIRSRNNPADGLYRTMINFDTGAFSSKLVTFGALGDSFYEYLLKVWWTLWLAPFKL